MTFLGGGVASTARTAPPSGGAAGQRRRRLTVVVQHHLLFPISNKVNQRQPDDSIHHPLGGFARQCPDGSARALLSSGVVTVGRCCEVAAFDGSTACDFCHTNSVPPTSPAQIHGVCVQIWLERHARLFCNWMEPAIDRKIVCDWSNSNN